MSPDGVLTLSVLLFHLYFPQELLGQPDSISSVDPGADIPSTETTTTARPAAQNPGINQNQNVVLNNSQKVELNFPGGGGWPNPQNSIPQVPVKTDKIKVVVSSPNPLNTTNSTAGTSRLRMPLKVLSGLSLPAFIVTFSLR